MKRSKFTEEQIAFALHQADTGTAVEEVCRKVGISQATFYAWKKKYGVAPIKPDTMRPFGHGCTALVISSLDPYAGATRCSH